MFNSPALFAILSLWTSYDLADAFAVPRTTTTGAVATTRGTASAFTRLFMAEDGDGETNTEQQETTAAGEAAGSDILSSPAFLKRKLEVLKSDIEKTEKDLAEALERVEVAKEEWAPQLEDLEREYSNIRERMSSQNEKGDAQAIVKVVQEVLGLLDNFDRAYGVIKPETDAEKAIEAEYKAAYQSILDIFEDLGVKEVETVGKEFDYEMHQAVMQMPGTEYDEGIVCQEFQKGFIMEETLIRPAMVAVAV